MTSSNHQIRINESFPPVAKVTWFFRGCFGEELGVVSDGTSLALDGVVSVGAGWNAQQVIPEKVSIVYSQK